MDFGDDPLGGFIESGLKAFGSLNPSGNLLSNASHFAGSLGDDAMANFDFGNNPDSNSPELQHSNEMDLFFFGGLGSTVDELGANDASNAMSDPFSGIQNATQTLFGLSEMFGAF